MTTEEKLRHFYDVSMESARQEAQKALEEYRKALDDMFEEHKKLNNPTVEQQVWLAKAGNLLEVPDSLVKDLRTYSLDPRDFNAYRDGLIELITTSTIQEVKPWGNAFGVNGIIE